MGRAHLHPLHIQLANGNAGSSSSASGFFNGNGSNTVHQPNNHGNHGISPLRLTPRDESTRVQLQKQRLQEQQRAASAALVSRNIPGFRTSAGRWESLALGLRDRRGHTTRPSLTTLSRSFLRIFANEPATPRFTAR